MGCPSRTQINQIKENYPAGTVIRMIHMEDVYAPIEAGTEGEVTYVDDIGTIHMKWANGRTLGINPFEDEFEVVSILEQNTQIQSQQDEVTWEPSMGN